MTNIFASMPSNYFRAACYSACFSFAISGLMSRNIRVGLISASLAATASFVGSLAMPLLQRFTDFDNRINLLTMASYQLLNLGILHLIGRHQKAYQIQFFASAFFTLLYTIWNKHDQVKIKQSGPVFIFV